MLHNLRLWDARTSLGVDHFIANSRFIARRILKTYRRSSTVIYPPVDILRFSPSYRKDDYYVTVSRLVPYKRVDLIVQAFAALEGRELVVVGDGPEMGKARSLAPHNVRFVGYQPADEVVRYLQGARAFLYAAEEDFGIAPVEAQACGTPVIAFGKGGVCESVRGLDADSPTGVFFAEQSPAAISLAVRRFESAQDRIRPEACRENSLRFSVDRFDGELREYVGTKWQEFQEDLAQAGR